jgi:phosphoribosylpyrophosphate synthetase
MKASRWRMKLFSGNANPLLAAEIARYLGIPVGNAKVSRFSDGEISCAIDESVRGVDVFVVQPTCTPVNENLMELLIMIDAFRRASASRINAVIPYYGYGRQDRKTRARDPITAKLVSNLIVEAGAQRVVAVDLHTYQIQGFFDIPVDHLPGVPTIGEYFKSKTLNADPVILSPDVGGVTRARDLGAKLGAPLAIVDKRKVLENLTESGLYPYSYFYLRAVKESSGQFWINHFSTIGLVGMNESCLNFLGEDIGSEAGHKFALEVMEFMQARIMTYKEETGNLYNLEATPAEGVSYSMPRKDKARYPDIIVANQDDVVKKGAHPFYTNSTHLPVGYTDDLYQAMKLQDPLQSKYTGGTTFHIFVGEALPDNQSVKNLIRKACEQFHMPYYYISPTFSICPQHGYLTGEHPSCPVCAGEGQETCCEVYSRVVGYLRPVDQWNEGKQQEFAKRKTYKIG